MKRVYVLEVGNKIQGGTTFLEFKEFKQLDFSKF